MRRGFIIVRDRIANLPQLVDWINSAGYQPTIIDNASTYPRLREYLATDPCEIVRLRFNHGHQAPWSIGIVQRLARGEPYLLTDPDIEPPATVAAADVVRYWQQLLDRYPDVVKVGSALRIDDLPAHYLHADQVARWEERHWSRAREPQVFDADLDTTLALWRGGTEYCFGPALRTAGPFTARHLDWYLNSDDVSGEMRYYRAHARRGVSHWAHDRLTEDKAAVLEARPYRRSWRIREGVRRRFLAVAARLEQRWQR